MRVLYLDHPFGYQPGVYASFGSDTTCFDFDVVVWSPGHALSEYRRAFPDPSYRGLPYLNSDSSARVVGDIARRRTEFKGFVEGGGILIVLVGSPQSFYYDTGRRSYSGTGRNRETTVHVEMGDVWSALPFGAVISAAAGANMQFKGGSQFAPFWKANSELFRYRSVLGGEKLAPLAVIKGTDRVVAASVQMHDGGAVVFLPSLEFPDDDDEHEDESKYAADQDEVADGDSTSDEDDDSPPATPSRAATFDASLRELADSLRQARNVESLPTWAARYQVPGEGDLRDQIIAQEKAIGDARVALTHLHEQLSGLESRKHLFTGSGRGLELEVRRVLELLGGVVEEPEPGRDDWKVTFPEGKAVVEVKGVSKSAAEKHAAQLEKWVANSLEEGAGPVKGILVVNAWNATEVADRDQAVFPAQMITYSKARGHCLISGLQLLFIAADVESNPGRAEHWRKQMFATSGILKGAEKWESVLTRIANATSDA